MKLKLLSMNKRALTLVDTTLEPEYKYKYVNLDGTSLLAGGGTEVQAESQVIEEVIPQEKIVIEDVKEILNDRNIDSGESEIDYNKMKFFALKKIAREKGMPLEMDTKKDEIIKYLQNI